ncbi:MAG: hypothetical protein ACQEWL_00755 [Pseudomonadota bacterium]|uniref:hypothetical protein n=1 Tax=Providencia manganoxydans TaxID=2923283 RepID=UPI0034E46F0D
MPVCIKKSQYGADQPKPYYITKVIDEIFKSPMSLKEEESKLIGLKIIGIENNHIVAKRYQDNKDNREYRMSKPALELYFINNVMPKVKQIVPAISTTAIKYKGLFEKD